MIDWMYLPFGVRLCSGALTLIIVFTVLLAALCWYEATRNATLYEFVEPGFAFKPLHRYHLSRWRLVLDLTQLEDYPEEDWVIEISPKAAIKLYGRTITVRTREGDKRHDVGGLDPFGAYWIAFPSDERDG